MLITNKMKYFRLCVSYQVMSKVRELKERVEKPERILRETREESEKDLVLVCYVGLAISW